MFVTSNVPCGNKLGVIQEFCEDESWIFFFRIICINQNFFILEYVCWNPPENAPELKDTSSDSFAMVRFLATNIICQL